jgi:hypothetical protein
VKLSPKKTLSCTTAFQQPHLDARFHKGLTNALTRKITPYIYGSFGSQEQHTAKNQLHSQLCSRLADGKVQEVTLRARRRSFPAQKALRSNAAQRAARLALQLAYRQTIASSTRKQLRIAKHPHNHLEE